jgi:hypothetical protein
MTKQSTLFIFPSSLIVPIDYDIAARLLPYLDHTHCLARRPNRNPDEKIVWEEEKATHLCLTITAEATHGATDPLDADASHTGPAPQPFFKAAQRKSYFSILQVRCFTTGRNPGVAPAYGGPPGSCFVHLIHLTKGLNRQDLGTRP